MSNICTEMLEGQVAVLSSGVLAPDEADQLLTSLRRSALYREDQDSYVLYPNRQLPRFMDKNCLDAKSVESNALLQRLLACDDRKIVSRDVRGCLLYTSPSPRDLSTSRMPSSA